MLTISKSKFFSRYLPAFLSVVLLVVGFLAYNTLRPQTKVAEAGWYNTGGTWGYRKSITIDHTKVSTASSTTLSDFPMLFSVTDSELKTVANGGKVGKDTGIDMLFTLSDGTTKLSHEIEKYASTTGETVMWVKIPSLSPTADTIIYLYYGNASASDQQSAAAVWDTNYKGVWHFNQALSTGAGNYLDSTGVNNGTLGVGNTTTATTSPIDGSLYFAGGGTNTTDYLKVAANASLYMDQGPMTISFWFYPKDTTSGAILQKDGTGGSAAGWRITKGSSNRFLSFSVDYSTTDLIRSANGGTFFTPGVWQYITMTWDGSSTAVNVHFYNNTTESSSYNTTTDGVGTIVSDSARDLYMAARHTTTGFASIGLDDVRISNIVRSADWIVTEYNNQSSPSTFYSYQGTGQGSGGGEKLKSQGVSSLGWYNTGGTWSYRKQIVIDRTKLSSTATTTYSNFPMLFSVTDADLKFTGSGGGVASSTGADILFTSSDGTTKLNHELEKYVSTTGETVAWVQIPLLNTASDAIIYMYYGNASASNQQNATAVWDTNYKGVWHLGNNLSLTDSTGSYNLSNTGGTSGTGQIDGAAAFDGASHYLSSASGPTLTSAMTVEVWAKRTTSGVDGPLVAQGINANGWVLDLRSNNYYEFNNYSGGLDSASTFADSNWHHIVVAGSTTNYTWQMYVDGVSQGAAPWGTLNNNASGVISLGYNSLFYQDYLSGGIDEVRLSDIVRSADWIATEYANQSSPSTFYSYGARSSNTRLGPGGTGTAPAIKARGGVKFR
jgi:hypothetical protein